MKKGISILVLLAAAFAVWLVWRAWPKRPAKSEVDEMLDGFSTPPPAPRPEAKLDVPEMVTEGEPAPDEPAPSRPERKAA